MPDADPILGAQNLGGSDLIGRIAAEQRAPLTRYAARLLGDADLARDVVQDTFAKLLVQPSARIEGHVVEWLFKVCRHRAIDLLRKKRASRPADEIAVDALAGVEPHPGRVLEARETQATLLRLIDRLPPAQQEVMRLKFQNGFSYKQIAKITDLTVTNVGFLIHTAVTHLRREWTQAEASRPIAPADAS